jgi:hypothetical protein
MVVELMHFSGNLGNFLEAEVVRMGLAKREYHVYKVLPIWVIHAMRLRGVVMPIIVLAGCRLISSPTWLNSASKCRSNRNEYSDLPCRRWAKSGLWVGSGREIGNTD